MIWLAFASALSIAAPAQTPYGQGDATPETYQPPVVRPFEPPSDFGRETAQGDAEAVLHRPVLTTPVAVDDYAGQYEPSPTDAQTAYDQGVSQAEIDADRRMGPLDGRWRVSGPDGRALFSLALTDRGEGRRVEGAWQALSAGASDAQAGPAGPAAQAGADFVIPADGGELRLHPAGSGWAGDFIRNGRSRPVTLSRPG